jgi:beta-lactamase superfamily II metal-dependent hydrolase
MNLEVHVFGADEGESILIKFPTGKWGVVDCYASSKDPSSNEPLKFLQDRNVEEIYFACLTHPHTDHYSGIEHILDKIPVQQFWYPGVMTLEHLKSIAKLEAQQQSATTATQYDSKLIDLFEKVNLRTLKSGLSIRRLSLGLNLGTDKDLGVRIESLAPSGDEAHRFDQSLTRCFNNGRLLEKKTQSEINRCSVALSLFFASQRLVLGGDVEKKGWRDLLQQQSHLATNASVVKVAHHGSRTGRSENLWSTYAKDTSKRVAVLTPYWKHRLPCPAVITEIRDMGYTLYSTSQIARPQQPFTPYQSLAKLVNSSPSTAKKSGCVSIEIDSRGNIRANSSGQAYKL